MENSVGEYLRGLPDDINLSQYTTEAKKDESTQLLKPIRKTKAKAGIFELIMPWKKEWYKTQDSTPLSKDMA